MVNSQIRWSPESLQQVQILKRDGEGVHDSPRRGACLLERAFLLKGSTTHCLYGVLELEARRDGGGARGVFQQ